MEHPTSAPFSDMCSCIVELVLTRMFPLSLPEGNTTLKEAVYLFFHRPGLSRGFLSISVCVGHTFLLFKFEIGGSGFLKELEIPMEIWHLWPNKDAFSRALLNNWCEDLKICRRIVGPILPGVAAILGGEKRECRCEDGPADDLLEGSEMEKTLTWNDYSQCPERVKRGRMTHERLVEESRGWDHGNGSVSERTSYRRKRLKKLLSLPESEGARSSTELLQRFRRKKI